jgi:hypothetical protein
MGAMQAQAMQQQVMASAAPGFGGYAEPAPADASVESQRLARLNEMHARKGC